jgi:hydroxymethylglutaryl-CoA lyase
MGDQVKIVECPRDAWQGLSEQIPPEVKADYLRKLVQAGFTHIDAVSFVSPAAVPQMADSEQVLKRLVPIGQVEIIGIVVNEQGAHRAIRTAAVSTLGIPYSVSAEFLRRNQHQTPEQSLRVVEVVAALARNAGLNLVAYLSMAFGNPYGDKWTIDAVMDACDRLVDSGVRQISLADTVGLATPDQVATTVAAVIGAHTEIEIGVHLHARQENAPARIRAAFDAGCRRFDAAIGGLGGCPFALDTLVGNIPTETLIPVLTECGATLPNFGPLNELMRASAKISNGYGALLKQ